MAEDPRYIDDKAEALRAAAWILNDELGEWWNDLTSLVPAYRDHASDELAQAIEAEIVSEHTRLMSDFRVLPETVAGESRVVKRLVHISYFR